jgi:LysR family transcriptional regulator, glycine cleavage system transcriptional activator
MEITSLSSLPLIALRAFEAAGRLKTMTAASEELCVTPGAVSRQIRILEEYLKVPLFTGPKNRPVLTPQGEIFLPILSNAMAQILAGIKAINPNQGNILNLSCLNTFAMRWLIPRLYRFNAAYPDIDVRLSTTALDTALKSEFDVAINVCKNTDFSPESVVLFPEKIGPVVTPEREQEYQIKSAKDLTDIPILQTRTRQDAWKNWCFAINEPDLSFSKAVLFDHYYFAIEAALGGLGICIAPHHLVETDIKTKRLIAPLGFMDSGYIYSADLLSPQNQATQDFMSWLKSEIQSTSETD